MKKFLFVFCVCALFLNAQPLRIGAGAGYKKPVMEVVNELNQKGFQIEAVFGNMGQICKQAESAELKIIIGDMDFIQNKCEVKFNKFSEIGKGILVFASNKKIDKIDEITNFSKIAIPQPQKAIYGIRAKQFLKNSGLNVKAEVLEVATVPQVSAYILSKDIDGGFINLTEAMAQKDKFLSVIMVDEKMYEPVLITAGDNCGDDKDCERFLDELKSENSKKIFLKYGLK